MDRRLHCLEEDLLIETAQMEGYVSENDGGITVVLDTNLTEELLEEGFVREIISKIQTMRKEADFEVTDKIRITYEGTEKAEDIFARNVETIGSETLALQVENDCACRICKRVEDQWRKSDPWCGEKIRKESKECIIRDLIKQVFKREVTENVKTLFRKTIEEATPQQLYQAVSYVVKEAIIDDWIATQETYEKEDPKIVYYMSMEFLMGRALGNNLINMTAYKEVREALDELGIDLNLHRGPGAGSGSWKRRTWTSGRLLPGFPGDSWICGIRMRHPLPLRYVQAEDRERIPGRGAGQLA